METSAKVCVIGSQTHIGAAILRALKQAGFSHVAPDVGVDLANVAHVDAFFAAEQPQYVFVSAGKSGGIRANQTYPADLMLDNLRIVSHVIPSAHRHGANKLLYLASSCTYPKYSPQPMRVESLMTGPLEPTNRAYATAKIAGIELCQAYRQQFGDNFIIGIPANEFGPGDDFDSDNAHVIGALLHRMHDAKVQEAPRVEIWGSGNPQREFIFLDDLADACLFLMQNYDGAEPINIGSGTAFPIRELAEQIQKVVGYTGTLHFDTSKPDGMPLKSLESSPLLSLGWHPYTPFTTALSATYEDFLKTIAQIPSQQNARELIHAG